LQCNLWCAVIRIAAAWRVARPLLMSRIPRPRQWPFTCRRDAALSADAARLGSPSRLGAYASPSRVSTLACHTLASVSVRSIALCTRTARDHLDAQSQQMSRNRDEAASGFRSLNARLRCLCLCCSSSRCASCACVSRENPFEYSNSMAYGQVACNCRPRVGLVATLCTTARCVSPVEVARST